MRRLLKRLVKLAILAAVANVALQLARRAMSDRQHHEPPIEPAWPAPKVDEPPAPSAEPPPKSVMGADDPEPAPAPATAAETSSATAWVTPDDAGDCPHGYPVKVKVTSGIYHLPGGLAYERTKPDRCYATPQAAEADGYRAAKR